MVSVTIAKNQELKSCKFWMTIHSWLQVIRFVMNAYVETSTQKMPKERHNFVMLVGIGVIVANHMLMLNS
jgi:hypothetical protein